MYHLSKVSDLSTKAEERLAYNDLVGRCDSEAPSSYGYIRRPRGIKSVLAIQTGRQLRDHNFPHQLIESQHLLVLSLKCLGS